MIRIANAPCSWGVIENTPGQRSGYALFLDEMQETGYAGTELGDWGFMPTDPATLKAELAARDLTLVASWVSVRLYDADYHEAGIQAAVRTAKLLAEVGGPDCLIVIGDDHSTVPFRHDNTGRIQPADSLDEAGWDVYTSGATRVAEAVKRETGLRAVIHNHGATYFETPAEIERFLNHTDPDLIGLCLDTGHYALGGGDPVAGIKKHADRIRHVHFKDFDPSVLAQADANGWGYQQLIAQGMFSELGTGSVDFPAILTALKEMNYDSWIVVEQDVWPGLGNPKENAARNRAYLRGLGL
ncbi:MAG: TIM barrel protein [Ardenticatenaceae bacterium]